MIDGKLAIVGCGNWGKNLVRNFCQEGEGLCNKPILDRLDFAETLNSRG